MWQEEVWSFLSVKEDSEETNCVLAGVGRSDRVPVPFLPALQLVCAQKFFSWLLGSRIGRRGLLT